MSQNRPFKPVPTKFPRLDPKQIKDPYRIQQEMKEALDPHIASLVSENQDGHCQFCMQSIHAIIKVGNFVGEQGFIGLCESHTEGLTKGSKIIGTKRI